MKRVKANDPAALSYMGGKYCDDEGDYEGAFEYYTRAAELGDMDAHYRLGLMYYDGRGVEKDDGKVVYHYEKAAIGGHPTARHNLAVIEGRNGNDKRAAKHYIIAAKLGLKESMNMLWNHYSDENITKDELETTLRSHQAAIDAMKSPQREAADAQQKRLQR
jgi:TPR repeat protein